MHKESMARIMAPLMAGLLCVSLVGCGCARSKDDGSGDDSQAASTQTEGEPDDSDDGTPAIQAEHTVHVLVGDGALDAVAELEKIGDEELACVITQGGDAEEAARALKEGEVGIVVVPLDAAGRIYTLYECPSMAIDALEGDLPLVSVVSYDFFRNDPEAVVSYVAHHRTEAEAAGKTFYRGSNMQDVLSAAIADLYVVDPDLVGGGLPPDNFYFLG